MISKINPTFTILPLPSCSLPFVCKVGGLPYLSQRQVKICRGRKSKRQEPKGRVKCQKVGEKMERQGKIHKGRRKFSKVGEIFQRQEKISKRRKKMERQDKIFKGRRIFHKVGESFKRQGNWIGKMRFARQERSQEGRRFGRQEKLGKKHKRPQTQIIE